MTLREWRGRLSQDKLAALLGISKRTLRRWERTGPPYVVHLLMALCTPEALGAPRTDENGPKP